MKKRYWILASLLAVLGLVGLILMFLLFHLKRNQDIDLPDFSDLAPTRQPIPDEVNAYPLLLEASEVYVEDEQERWAAYYKGGEQDPVPLYPLIESNQVAFSKVRESTPLSGYWFTMEYSYDSLMPELSVWMNLGRLMMLDAERSRLEGRYDEAALRLIDLNQFGLKVGSDGAALHSQLAGIAISQLGIQQTGVMIRDPNCPVSALTRMEVSLREGERFLDGSAESLRSEFTMIKTMFEQLSQEAGSIEGVTGQPENPMQNVPLVWGYMYHPNRSLLLAAEYLRPFIRNTKEFPVPLPLDTQKDMWDDWNSLSPQEQAIRPNSMGMLALGITLPAVTRAIDRTAQAYASREATRLMIGLRLYEFKNGNLPETLEELVPAIFPELPLDPFSGLPFRYDRERALIWSVGPDRVDQGGSVLDRYGDAGTDADSVDQVFSLRKTFAELQEDAQKQNEKE